MRRERIDIRPHIEPPVPRYPPINPYEEGFLDTGDGNLVHWELCGNPSGKPALIVHGGPGSGLSTGQRQWLDPARYPHQGVPRKLGFTLVGHQTKSIQAPNETGVQDVWRTTRSDWLARGASS